jgi:hypothetical protein
LAAIQNDRMCKNLMGISILLAFAWHSNKSKGRQTQHN